MRQEQMRAIQRETKLSWLMFGAGALLSLSVFAEDPDYQYGAATEEPGSSAAEGGITAEFQHADDRRIKDEAFASFDFVATMAAGAGQLTLYIEGNATPRTEGVSSVLPGANTDAGTALDAKGKGRLQVSEFHYALETAGGSWTLGLLNPKRFLDTSAVANNETTQFLGSALVNNVTIAFPDYTLGTVYTREIQAAFSALTLLITSSNGLADNKNRSYPELFSVGQKGKGVFAAAEFFREWQAVALRLGAWVNSADYERWDGTGTASDYGIYGVLDWPMGGGTMGARIGLANENVAKAANFVALAWEYPLNGAAIGIGAGHGSASDKFRATDPGNIGDLTQAEVYIRLGVRKDLEVTPSVQSIRNSGFLRSEMGFDRSAVVTSLRVNYTF